MPLVEIWDPRVKLDELLDLVVDDTGDLRWSIMELWGVGKNDDVDVVTLEQRAANSPTGVELSTQELRQIAQQLGQFIDGIVVGYRGTPPTRSDPDLRRSAEVVIEAIDSTLWRVYASHRRTLATLHDHYDDVRDVPEVIVRPVHDWS